MPGGAKAGPGSPRGRVGTRPGCPAGPATPEESVARMPTSTSSPRRRQPGSAPTVRRMAAASAASARQPPTSKLRSRPSTIAPLRTSTADADIDRSNSGKGPGNAPDELRTATWPEPTGFRAASEIARSSGDVFPRLIALHGELRRRSAVLLVTPPGTLPAPEPAHPSALPNSGRATHVPAAVFRVVDRATLAQCTRP
jgi:hypothetical protein